MRSDRSFVGWLALLLGVGMSPFFGCVFSTPHNCANAGEGCPGSGGAGNGGGGGATATTTSGMGGHDGGGGTGGGGGGKPASCVPSMNPGTVEDSCGVFVSSSMGADTNAGTQAKPFKSIMAALGAANGMPVYVCGEPFSEPVTVSSAVTLYGALDCAKEWVYEAATKTQLTAVADAVPLTLVSSANGAEVLDFAITAADVMMAGGSSIAVLADQATATLTRCDLVAGNGATGAAGTTPSGVGPNDEGQAGTSGMSGTEGCMGMAAVIAGGLGGQSTCGVTDVSGAEGGNGLNTASGGDGSDAKPQPEPGAMPGSDGLHGPGQTAVPCKAGDAGANGSAGMSGAGATGIGMIGASGYTGPTATDGQSAGTSGYGGGGGGGAAVCKNGEAGPSGGGGGSGGCGGLPGRAGGPGGSSIALLSNNATITLTDATLTSGSGGAGGVGGNGQHGGVGGTNSTPGTGDNMAAACGGGAGGQGGRGGSAGGGLGGHSLGIAFLGQAPMQTTGVVINDGSAGPGAIGGDGNATLTGAAGVACKILNFADASSCM
jgi:hypothetical protein